MSDLKLPILVKTGSLGAYISSVNAIPMLSAERERELAIAYRERNDIQAARELVLAHLRFVVRMAYGYDGYGLPLADLVQEGNIGLMKALKRYDPNQKARFLTFATHWIRSEIMDYIVRNWRMVKIATTKAQRKLFFNLRRARSQLARLGDEEAQRIAADLNVDVKELRHMERRFNEGEASLDAPMGDSDDGGQALPRVNYLPASDSDPASNLEREDWERSSHARLSQLLEELDERQRDIIRQRWLGEKRATLQVLADKYGVSVERIRQLEQGALKKLRVGMDDFADD